MKGDTEKEGENGFLFLTPQWGNTPSLEDSFQVKPPTIPLFIALTSANPGQDFPVLGSSHQNEYVLRKQNWTLKS